jgi:hypothetical protein
MRTVRLGRTGLKISDRGAGSLAGRELLGALRRLEVRAEICGGRFVSGYVGEQFAPGSDRSAMRRGEDSEVLDVSDHDPLRLRTHPSRERSSYRCAPSLKLRFWLRPADRRFP